MSDKRADLALIAAVLARDTEAAERALQMGANIDAPVRYPPLVGTFADGTKTPLAWSLTHSPVAEIDTEVADFLLAKGADIDAVSECGFTALHLAIALQSPWNWQAVVGALLVRGADPNIAASSGRRPLETALRAWCTDVARSLLEHGAWLSPGARRVASRRPESSDLLETWAYESPAAGLDDTDQALFSAARRGATREVRALLKKGASPVAQDADGRLPSDHARALDQWAVTRLLDVALVRASDLAAADTELLLAALDDRPNRIRAALAAGADLEVVHVDGRSALMLAAEHRSAAAVRRLLAEGAAVSFAQRGVTALVCACRAGAAEMVGLLLERGADADRTHRRVNLALSAAVARQDAVLLRLLLAHGASIPARFTATGSCRHPSDPEVGRLIDQARLGNRPVAERRFTSHESCDICRPIPERAGWTYDHDTEETVGEALPVDVGRFEIIGGYPELLKCPHCHSYYHYEKEHDGSMPGGYDCEWLWRRTPQEVQTSLSAMNRAFHTARTRRELDRLRQGGRPRRGRVALNSASAADLAALPGIGARVAASIVADRAKHGPFASCAEVGRVRGVGPRTVARIVSHCRAD